MRESNFIFPAHNRACVCISSTLYDRRALDAPAASLPLVNSLTHLSYLTATSARIRESLSSDGGLERLVRILQNCANPTALPTSLADVKGKGPLLPKRKAWRSPFKAFADYDLLPSLDELRDLQGGDAAETLLSLLPSLPPTSLPSNLHLPPSLKARHLLYTYTLAFQCIVNIGVRGSEAIRTRVVEAGALEVVVHVLERYLEEIERKRVRNQMEWHKAEQARIAQVQLQEVQAMMEGGRSQQQEEEVVVIVDTSSPVIPTAPTPTRPRLTRINIVAASSSATVGDGLAPPSRVQTPDTVLSTDDASLTGDDNGSSSGQETEEITMSTSTSDAVEVRMSIKAEGSGSAGQEEGGETAPVVAATDDNGDVMMSGPSSPVEERSEAEVEGGTSGQEEERQPTPRSAAQPGLPAAPTSTHRTPRATESRGPRHPHHPHHPTPPSASPLDSSSPPLEPEGQLYFRDEDVLLALQLLAYLSKYPHVREVFHCPSSSSSASSCDSDCEEDSTMNPTSFAHSHPLIRPHSVNIFSLVELFTHRPPSDDPFTPRLSNEVQYWACTIMRNACRKDEQRGGIRQCANMNCGKWEQYAREFAKCRRCRRAKYCSKACQSASWGNGHKFWCHKQSTDDRSTRRRTTDSDAAVDSAGVATPTNNASPVIPNDPRRRQQPRHRRNAGGAGGEEDEEDDFDELPPPPTGTALPHGTRTPGPTARNRSGTIPTNQTHHHHHPLVQPTNLPGLEAVTGNGQVDAAGMPLGVDEDLIAREMMEMGDQQGVRVQDA